MNPFSNYFDNGAIIRYGQVLASVFSELKVEVEGRIVRIPIEYMGGIKDFDKVTNTVSVGLSSTLKFAGVTIPEEGVPNKNLTEVMSDGAIERPPLPVILQYEYNLKFKKMIDATRALEQIIFHTYPHLTLKVINTRGVPEVLSITATSYELNNNYAGDGEEPDSYELTFMLDMVGGKLHGSDLSQGGTSDKYTVIKEVDIYYGFYQDIPTNLTESGTWMKLYTEEVVIPRFENSLPLGFNEGAYVVKYEGGEPVTEVIGSYTWVNEEYIS